MGKPIVVVLSCLSLLQLATTATWQSQTAAAATSVNNNIGIRTDVATDWKNVDIAEERTVYQLAQYALETLDKLQGK